MIDDDHDDEYDDGDGDDNDDDYDRDVVHDVDGEDDNDDDDNDGGDCDDSNDDGRDGIHDVDGEDDADDDDYGDEADRHDNHHEYHLMVIISNMFSFIATTMVQRLPVLLRVRPVQDTHKLCIAWQLPRTQHLYLSKPLNYVAHLTGHEGAGSLQAWLKSQGLATEVDAGVSDEDDWNSNAMKWSYAARKWKDWARHQSYFIRDLVLLCRMITARCVVEIPYRRGCPTMLLGNDMLLLKGLKYKESAIFLNPGPQKWIHDELVQEETDPMEYVQKLAKSEWMLSQWDPDGISAFLRLMVPRSAFVVLLSSAYGRARGAQQEEETLAEDPEVALLDNPSGEEGLLTSPDSFGGATLQDGVLESCTRGKSLDGALGVSSFRGEAKFKGYQRPLCQLISEAVLSKDRNPFLATNFELCPAPAQQEASVDTWLSEHGVESRLACRKALLVRLARVLSDSLNEVSYLAEQASLDLRIRDELYGLDVRVGGSLEAHPPGKRGPRFLRRCSAQREELLRSLRNEYTKPGDHCADLRRSMAGLRVQTLSLVAMLPGVMASRTLATERADALEALQELIPQLDVEATLRKVTKERIFDSALVLFIGNATSEDARQLVAAFPAPAHVPHPPARVVRVPVAEPLVWVEDSHDTGNRNVAVEMYWQLGPVGSNEAKDAAQVELLADLIAEPLFDSLRTKQQIGYVASCGARWTHRVQGFSVWLMSSKFGPAEICRRALKFLADFQKSLEDMPEEDFAQHVCSLAAQKLEPDRTLNSMQAVAWAELQERNHVFDRSWREALALAALSRRELLELLRELQGSKRLIVAAVVGGRAKGCPGGAAAERQALSELLPSSRAVSNREDLLRSAELYASLV
ncbi:Insulin-degrading enzyme [Symbiodinium microadriaticum]|uniref:Insulin-degrading enzyme n=1 Tax=Symbiodinium microadriaticum TaxID=2951 RepID=A0A1Q9ESB3_SYMMI|nr:Insulin-degrading enzyme [Symbiodinium microadriaticum]